MALMSRPRRHLALILMAIFALPGLAMCFLPAQRVSAAESRALAEAPGRPRTAKALLRLPRGIDSYVADHFAGRDRMIRIARRVFGKTGMARASGGEFSAGGVDGRNGRMFLTEGLLRSTGQLYEPDKSADYVAYVCEVGRAAQAAGVRFVFGIAPSPATIYPQDAPTWALPVRPRTEYDAVIAGVRACGLPAADMRPALRAARADHNLYRLTDSHWTPRGALMGYNQMVERMGRRDWRIEPSTVRWTTLPQIDGDLPRVAGREPMTELVEQTDLIHPPASARRVPVQGVRHGADAPFVVETGHAGPSVLVVGDSYSLHYFPGLFSGVTSRLAWAHAENCTFDWKIVEATKPDYLILMPVERFTRCRGRPRNFPG